MTLGVSDRDRGLTVPHSGFRRDVIIKHAHHLLLKLQNLNGLGDRNEPNIVSECDMCLEQHHTKIQVCLKNKKKEKKNTCSGITFDQEQARWSGSYSNMKQQGLQDVATPPHHVILQRTLGYLKSHFMLKVAC